MLSQTENNIIKWFNQSTIIKNSQAYCWQETNKDNMTTQKIPEKCKKEWTEKIFSSNSTNDSLPLSNWLSFSSPNNNNVRNNPKNF